MKQERRAESLGEWVDVATRGLCAGAQNRIAEDIYEHLAEALEEGLGRGLSYEEVKRDAVASLGDPKAANREFRKTHLTEYEASAYDRFVSKPFQGTLLPVASTLFVIWDMRGFIPKDMHGIAVAALGALCIWIVGREIQKRVRSRLGERASFPFGRFLFTIWLLFVFDSWPAIPSVWNAFLPITICTVLLCAIGREIWRQTQFRSGILARFLLEAFLGLCLLFLFFASSSRAAKDLWGGILLVYFEVIPAIALWLKTGRSRVALDDHDLGGPGMA